MFGKITYFNLEGWSEHKLKLSLKDCKELFDFIEDAVMRYGSCMVVSQRNKCATIVVAIIYLMLKYKWDLHRCLEYINARKSDVEITVSILKQLQLFEKKIKQLMDKSESLHTLRDNWNINFDIFNPLNDKFVSQFNIQKFQSPDTKRGSPVERKEARIDLNFSISSVRSKSRKVPFL